MEIATSQGPAQVTLDEVADPAFLLAMTHGSNGGVDAPDLLAVRDEALRLGGAVARVMQPFRVAGTCAGYGDQAGRGVADGHREAA